MANRSLPDARMLRQLLDYDDATGGLVWLPRVAGMPKRDGLFVTQREAGIFNTQFSGKPAFATKQANGYQVGSLFDRGVFAHVVIWAMHAGRWPTLEVDHIDGDYLNNRVSNLREVTAVENQRNRRLQKNNTSGCMGVNWHNRDKAWRAWIATSGGKNISLGYFSERADAIAARKHAEKIHGYHENHGRLQ